MVWYYDYEPGPIIICDIYGTKICDNNDVSVYPFKLESIYRYSGLLYDKLKHLLGYTYINGVHTPPAASYISNRGDCLYSSVLRFDTSYMSPRYKTEICHFTLNFPYLRESVARNLYFILS